MRNEFEKLPEIAELLNDKEKGFFYNEDFEVYGTNPVNDFDAGFINGALYAYQEQQKRIDEIKKMTASLRSEFDLWSDGMESFNAIEAQIENLEDLLK